MNQNWRRRSARVIGIAIAAAMIAGSVALGTGEGTAGARDGGNHAFQYA